MADTAGKAAASAATELRVGDHVGARGVLDGGVVQARLQGVGQLDVADGARATLDVTGHAGVAVPTLALGEGGLLAVEAGGPVRRVHRGAGSG